MCHYCGCREIPLIKEFIAEHDAVTDLAGAAVRAMDQGDLDRARALVAPMAELLRLHWAGEENGLFAVMREDDEYADYIAALEDEHRELAAFLAALDLDDPAQRTAFTQAADELRHHIAKEEDGLFPASLTALSGEQWNLAMAAWSTAHTSPTRSPAALRGGPVQPG
ncbi:hemerythrin domain-containing protein [Streptacidiphilus cavernicola]|uniref:Hemerythrin domain-containing protein n=1 Tax=Streptacidiphilus cavernicola TaxID=3342716 RepID=A0ABV6VPC0_9ACTN